MFAYVYASFLPLVGCASLCLRYWSHLVPAGVIRVILDGFKRFQLVASSTVSITTQIALNNNMSESMHSPAQMPIGYDKVMKIKSKPKRTSAPRRKNQKYKKHLQQQGLLKFFGEDKSYFQTMMSIITKKHRLSLRALNFLCSCMALRDNIPIKINGDVGSVSAVYDNCLNAYGKNWLDAFKRSERTTIELHDCKLTTTIAQLTFFRMLKQNNIINYAMDHVIEIEDMMSQELRQTRRKANICKAPVQKKSRMKPGKEPVDSESDKHDKPAEHKQPKSKSRKKQHPMCVHNTTVTLSFF